MANRIDLYNLLVGILETRNVYYQPPESLKLKYPCIVYNRRNISNVDANNAVYLQNYTYRITVIYTDPDSDLPQKISKIVNCRHIHQFVSDGLYHDVFDYSVNNTK